MRHYTRKIMLSRLVKFTGYVTLAVNLGMTTAHGINAAHSVPQQPRQGTYYTTRTTTPPTCQQLAQQYGDAGPCAAPASCQPEYVPAFPDHPAGLALACS